MDHEMPDVMLDLTNTVGKTYKLTPESDVVFSTPQFKIAAGAVLERNVPLIVGKDIGSGDYAIRGTQWFWVNGHPFQVTANLLRVQIK